MSDKPSNESTWALPTEALENALWVNRDELDKVPLVFMTAVEVEPDAIFKAIGLKLMEPPLVVDSECEDNEQE